ncbi:MAG: CerR family C-terminal domain-containing protein [Alphaproteobacteria bacterium]|nr:CerR family C-terminal domain-containing protein [Alphaproteobacteria bacterium]
MTVPQARKRRSVRRSGRPAPHAGRAAGGEATRQRLIAVALDSFGRQGFEGASTRTIARKAKANISAILYHFGGKQGLYLAVAGHIADFIGERIASVRAHIEAALRDGGVDPDAAIALLDLVIARQVTLLAEPETEAFARFIVREQQDPTEAFEVLYERVMGVMLPLVRQLVAIATGDDPRSEAVGLRTFAIAGQFLVFRVARATVLRHMHWPDVGLDQVQAIAGVVQQSARAMLLAARAENTR